MSSCQESRLRRRSVWLCARIAALTPAVGITPFGPSRVVRAQELLKKSNGGEYVGHRLDPTHFETCGKTKVTIEDGDNVKATVERCKVRGLPNPTYKDFDIPNAP